MTATFNQNLLAIRMSDFVVCSTEDKDVGSLIEAGFALALSKPIIYVNFTLGTKSFNLMLSCSGLVAKNEKDLEALLKIISLEGLSSEKLNNYIHRGEIE
jgi:nucleoside 2-deoxyribosyltransferase